MDKKVSIIVVDYDVNRLQRQITSACLGNIQKYTDPEDYELILIDQWKDKENRLDSLDDKHNAIKIDKYVSMPNIGSSAAFNLGAKKSVGEYLVFMHNDVFVWEGWLRTLLGEIEGKEDVVIMPHQGHTTREQILQFHKEPGAGNDDAGLIMMSRKTFNKTGGWDERFKAIYQDVPFRSRFPKGFICTNKCLITHIGCGTVYAIPEDEENKAYEIEGNLYNDWRSNNTGKNINYL